MKNFILLFFMITLMACELQSEKKAATGAADEGESTLSIEGAGN